jgi:5'-nucleotidase
LAFLSEQMIMRILVSNDDGYSAPGIQALADALQEIEGVTLTVFAPEINRSGASNSLTLNRPLLARKAANGFFYVNGTPSDCIQMALASGLLKERPDLIVSGINDGANMGEDTLYSGTVAAAIEGHLFGIPAIAFSLNHRGWEHLDAAATMAARIVQHQLSAPLSAAVLLNVNFPNRPLDKMGGPRVTRLGRRHYDDETMIKTITPHGEAAYWIGPSGLAADAGPGTDFHAMLNDEVSVTPLRIDLTHEARLSEVCSWAKPLCVNR